MTIIYSFILCIITYKLIPKKNQVLAALGIGFLMSVIAFFLTEKNQHDLIYYREAYDTLQDEGYLGAIAYSAVDRSPLFIWIVYGLSYLEDNRFTSAIPTFIGYFILVYLLGQTSIVYEIKKRRQLIFLIFLLFILPWQDYSAGIRGALAYSLCTLGIYFEFRKQMRFLGFIFYIFPIFIHQASIIFLFLRLFLYLIEIIPSIKKYIYLLCFLIGFITEFMGPAIESLARITGLRILSIVSNSFNSYAIEEKDLYEPRVVILRISAILLIYIITRKYIISKQETNSESNIFSIYTMLMLLSIGFIWQYDIVCRYTVACMILSSLILYRCNQKYITTIIIFAIINLISYYDSYYSKWEIIFQ